MTTPINTQPSPFTDPNNALREFNAYFGSLRKDYGEDAIRAMGFTPRDLAALQASLRNLQMDPSATPEQHRQAYMQARDTLAQRITTPLASTRSYAQVQGLGQSSPQSAADIAAGVVQPAPAMLPMATPTQEQLYEYARGVAQGQQSLWDPRIGKFVPAPTEAAASPFAVAPMTGGAPVGAPVGAPPMPDMQALMAEKAAAEKAAEAARDPYAKPRPSNYVVVGETGGYPVYGPPPVTPPAPVPSASDYIADMARPTPMPVTPTPVPAGAQKLPMPGYYRGGPVMRYR
jgi:hypothetical protein